MTTLKDTWWWWYGVETASGCAISSMTSQKAGEEARVEFWRMTIVNCNLGRAEGLYQSTDEVEDFGFLIF